MEVFKENKTDGLVTLVKPVELRTTLNDLPHELLFEIFYRLPFTTIFFIRCTCKLWYKLTADPRMLATQLSGQRPISVGHLVSLSGVEHKMCYVEKVGSRLCCLGPIIRHRWRNVSPYPRSSGGLVLYETTSGWPRFYYVENPITGEGIQIPVDKLVHASHGFGYSPSTNEYKLVKLEGMPPLSVAIFTLGSGHWRRLGDTPFYPDSTLPFECEGVIFWKISQDRKAIDMNKLVMSFDVASECFQTWQGPALSENINRDDIHIAKIGKSAACVYGKWSNTLQVWVLRDIRKDVWVKEHNICSTSFPRVVFDPRISSGSWIGNDVFFGRDNFRLLSCYRYYYSANDDDNGGYKFMTCPIQGAFLGAVDHIGSLVSPLKLMNEGKD